MVDFKQKSAESQQKDYKERFEFVLTTGGNIICQRYFRIGNFNPISLKSNELMDTIRGCAEMIDNDLKEVDAIIREYYDMKPLVDEKKTIKKTETKGE